MQSHAPRHAVSRHSYARAADHPVPVVRDSLGASGFDLPDRFRKQKQLKTCESTDR